MTLLRAATAVLLPFLLLPSLAAADELSELRARNAQLEATVEELTLQLADALREIRRLEAAVAAAPATAATTNSAAAPAAMIEEEVVAAGVATGSGEPASFAGDSAACPVSEALAGYDGKRAGNEALTAWLKSSNHLTVCSTEQLEELRAAIKWDWLGYEKEAIRLLDGELEARR